MGYLCTPINVEWAGLEMELRLSRLRIHECLNNSI